MSYNGKMILLLASFIAGVLTVLAPCILPILPVIIGGSLDGGTDRRRALAIVGSLGLSLVAFTLLLKASTVFIGVPESFWKLLSGGIVIAFGLVLLFPTLWERLPFVSRLSRGSNRLMGQGYRRGGFWGDVLIGASLGPVFSACSPTYFIVLASVLPVSYALGVIYLAAYVLGLCLVLLLIALTGQRLVDTLGFTADPKGTFRRVVGVLFVLVGIAVITGADRSLQIRILDAGFVDVTKIEQRLLKLNQ